MSEELFSNLLLYKDLPKSFAQDAHIIWLLREGNGKKRNTYFDFKTNLKFDFSF